MDRRMFLRSTVAVAALGAGGILSACQPSGQRDSAGAVGETQRPAQSIPDGEPTLAPVIASFELLTGPERTVPFGLRTLDNVEVADADVAVYLQDLEGEVLGGPYPATYSRDAGQGLGLYVTTVALPQAGQLEFVAVSGDDYGTQAINVASPETAQVQVPGDEAVVTQTATVDKPMGLAQLCTQDPPCGMHEVSLDDALADGRPVMLLFATPAYCQTAVCGPAVATVDEVRTGGDWGNVTWIHSEIYADAGQTLAKPVQAWKLPTEPWLFSIAADGTIADRLDGAMLPEMVREMAGDLQGG